LVNPIQSAFPHHRTYNRSSAFTEFDLLHDRNSIEADRPHEVICHRCTTRNARPMALRLRRYQ
jgi:hypothetical protein